MNTSDRLDQLFIKGHITELDYWKQRANQADKIIALLEAELAEAHEMHDQAQGKDAQAALYHLIRATTITHLLEEIEND